MNEQELTLEVEKVKSEQILVTNQAEYESAGEFLKTIKGQQKKVIEFFKDIKSSAKKAHSDICEKEKSFLEPLKNAESKIKDLMGDYYRIEQARIRAEEERQRKEAEEMQALVEIATEDGDTQTAMEAIIESACITSNVTSQVKAKGISQRKVWRFRVVNPALVPDSFKIINESAISAIAKTFKDKVTMPINGVEFYEEYITIARG